MKIYTKTGDKGQTGLYGGTRVSKSSPRVESYGNIDELNAFIGMAKSHVRNNEVISQLKKIQFDLFTLGAEAATPSDKLMLTNGKTRLPLTISEVEIQELEMWMDAFEETLVPLQFFILPGGCFAVTTLHVARTVCRRAERSLVFLNEVEPIRPEMIKYLNRLSDYLFVLSRYVAHLEGDTEEFWNPAEKY